MPRRTRKYSDEFNGVDIYSITKYMSINYSVGLDVLLFNCDKIINVTPKESQIKTIALITSEAGSSMHKRV